jgi:hypothetical protein
MRDQGERRATLIPRLLTHLPTLLTSLNQVARLQSGTAHLLDEKGNGLGARSFLLGK